MGNKNKTYYLYLSNMVKPMKATLLQNLDNHLANLEKRKDQLVSLRAFIETSDEADLLSIFKDGNATAELSSSNGVHINGAQQKENDSVDFTEEYGGKRTAILQVLNVAGKPLKTTQIQEGLKPLFPKLPDAMIHRVAVNGLQGLKKHHKVKIVTVRGRRHWAVVEQKSEVTI